MYSTQQSESVVGNTWDPLAAVVQKMDFNEADRISSYSIRLPLDQETSDLVAANGLSSCDNGRPHEDMSSLPFSESYQLGSQLGNAPCLPHSTETSIKLNKRKSLAESGALTSSQCPENSVQVNVKDEGQHDVSLGSFKDPTGVDEKKQKDELRPCSNSHRSTAKNVKGSSKDEFIHVRAKRGQATNSHSLAERVRREKISERMRLLQDLVPGCSKINGKAMMLDEIINYVQSLQRQVEFLSMKLATVNPELNFNLEQILSKDAQSCYGGSAVLAFGPGMNRFQPQLYGSTFPRITQPETFYAAATSSGELLQTMAQLSSAWHDEIQISIPMSSTPAETLTEHNGINPLIGSFKSC